MVDIEESKRGSNWRQIAIVLIASALTAIVSCGGGFLLSGSRTGLSRMMVGVLMMVGMSAIVVFAVAAVIALIILGHSRRL